MSKRKYEEGSLMGPQKIELIERWTGYGASWGIFVCPECDNWFEAKLSNIVSGSTKSCGCRSSLWRGHRVGISPANKTHGLSESSYYRRWHGMMRRCYDSTVTGYRYWGGRGVKVCDRWHTFEFFKEDIDKQLKAQNLTLGDWGKGKDQYTLDRRDNGGDYEPTNIRFATPKEQSNNQRKRQYE